MPHSIFIEPDFTILMHLVKQIFNLEHLLVFGIINGQFVPQQFINLLTTKHHHRKDHRKDHCKDHRKDHCKDHRKDHCKDHRKDHHFNIIQ